eukprot:3713458-Pyramimonas_sp.AAC.1
MSTDIALPSAPLPQVFRVVCSASCSFSRAVRFVVCQNLWVSVRKAWRSIIAECGLVMYPVQ